MSCNLFDVAQSMHKSLLICTQRFSVEIHILQYFTTTEQELSAHAHSQQNIGEEEYPSDNKQYMHMKIKNVCPHIKLASWIWRAGVFENASLVVLLIYFSMVYQVCFG